IAADRLRKVTLAAKLGATPAQLQVSDIDLRFDATKVTGGALVALPEAGQRSRPGYGVALDIDQINLDGYMPQPGKPAPGRGGQRGQGRQGRPGRKSRQGCQAGGRHLAGPAAG